MAFTNWQISFREIYEYLGIKFNIDSFNLVLHELLVELRLLGFLGLDVLVGGRRA